MNNFVAPLAIRIYLWQLASVSVNSNAHLHNAAGTPTSQFYRGEKMRNTCTTSIV
jgi:hypothetical protein